jgi:hypothetical protein
MVYSVDRIESMAMVSAIIPYYKAFWSLYKFEAFPEAALQL